MDDLTFIIGLARENSEALGFIPAPRISDYYIPRQQYIIQTDGRGKKTGYLIHGQCVAGKKLSIAQACIDFDFRDRGMGRVVVDKLITRASLAGVPYIKLRCAEDLQSNLFWKTMGFELIETLHPENRRKRAINVYTKLLNK